MNFTPIVMMYQSLTRRPGPKEFPIRLNLVCYRHFNPISVSSSGNRCVQISGSFYQSRSISDNFLRVKRSALIE